MTTLMNLWSPAFAAQPAVFIPDGPEVTYGQLQAQVESVVAALRDGGIEPGDAGGIVLGNNLEDLVPLLATAWALCVAAPVNPGYKVEEFRFYLEDSRARAVIVPPGGHPARDAAKQLGLPTWECSLDGGSVVLRPSSLARSSPRTTDYGPRTT